MKKRLAMLASVATILILSAGCGAENASRATPAPEQPPATAKVQQRNTPEHDAVVAQVGAHEIRYGEMAEQMATLEHVYSSAGAQYTQAQLKDLLHEAALDTLETLIQSYLLDQKIEEYGIELTPDESRACDALWDGIWEETKAGVQREQPDLTGEDLNVMIEAKIMSKGLNRESVQAMAVRGKKLEKLRALATKEVGQPTQQELEAEYARLLSQQQEQFEQDVTNFERMMLDESIVVYVPRDYRVLRQLDLTFDQDVIDMLKQLETYDSIEGDTYQDMERNERKILKEEKIPTVIKRIEDGTPFTEIMEEHKSGSSERRNYICRDSTRFSQEYYDAAFSISGTSRLASNPVQQKYGYTLLYWEDSLQAGIVEPERVYGDIAAQLTKQAEADLWKELQSQWRSETDITIYEAVLAY